jgi:hypothetical protein
VANALSISGSETAAELQAKSASGDSYDLAAKAVTQFISRYIQDEISAQDLEQIGDVLESAEFFEYVGPGSDGLIAQVVFQFSTPQANGAITKEAAERWLQLLA